LEKNYQIFVIFAVFAFLVILSSNDAFGINTFSVGATPIPVVVNPNTNMIYVGNAGSNTVSVVDGSTNTVLTNVTVGFTPVALAIDTNANVVYVANLNSANVSVINATTNTVIVTISVGVSPTGIGFDSNLKKVYVANSASGTVSVIDVLPGSPTKNSVISTVPLSSGIRAVAVIPNNHEVIVTSGASDILYVINGTTNTVTNALHIGIAADPVTVNPTNNLIYTADLGTGTVTVINGTTNTVIASIHVGNNPDGIGVNSITKKVYVADFVDNAVAVINSTTNTIVGEFQVFTPARLAVNEVTNKVYVANLAFHSVSVLDGTAPNPPLANAGPDQKVLSGTVVTLSGSSTSPGTLSFSWTQTTGPSVVLSNANIANPTFTAPSVNAATLLTFRLIVSDGISNSVPSFVNIIVNPINTFVVNLTPTSAKNLTGSVNIGNVINGSTTSIIFNTPPGTLPFAQLEQNVIPSAVNGNGVSLNYSVSANTPISLPKPPINQALFFNVAPSGIDFSKSSSFPANHSPLVRFQVNSNFTSQNRFSDGCPVIPILLFNESTKQWQQLGNPQKSNTNKIFVPTTGTNSVSVIDGNTNNVIATIPVGGHPNQLGFDTGNNMVYVPNRSTNNVSVINATTNTVVATIPVGFDPTEITILPDLHKVYVSNAGSDTVSVIDVLPSSPTVNTVISTIPVGKTPFELTANPATNRVYVSNFFSDSVSVINANTDTVVNTIQVTNLPAQIGVNPVTNKIYVANFFERIVWVIDGTPGSPTENSIISTIIVGNNPTGIVIDPSTNMMYVSNGFPNTVSVIDLSINTKVATIPVGLYPNSVTINLNTKRIYAANENSNTISIIDVLPGSPTENTVIATIPTDNDPITVELNPDVSNPVRDPSTDVKDGFGNIIQCSYLGNLPHLSKFAVGGIIPALAILGAGGGGEPGPSLGFSTLLFSTLPDAIKNSILHHDPFKPIAPSTDPSISYPLSIDGKGYLLGGYSNTIQTVTEETGAPVDLHMISQDGAPLQHVALYANLQGSSKDLYDSDTYIIYDEGKPLQIVDPHGFFSNVKFDIKDEGLQHELTYTITFAKPMAKSDLDLRMWDESKHSSDTKIYDALQVVTDASQANNDQASNNNSILTDAKATTTQNSDIIIAIKDWGGYSSHPISDSEFLSDVGIKGHEIPHWAMKTTKWILDGEISPQDFANTLKYMEEKGILK